ncbi:MAG: alanine--tRNA ligase [Candidatus Pacebacteria bacterium]|nr:alanine--tRNA ligase [Candidatus Paceibacterota bacterium]MCF7862924.1 alanine--tRNA ligase [Candidatus Paceibacterota bacterium]
MNSNEIRKSFLDFFARNGHTIVPSSSLIPEGDLSVLFTTAGMQQFKPYYIAPENALKDFGSKNTASSQKCVRTGDIEEVGDTTHLTFFEMFGNFSFGGYEKEEAIKYAFEFITKELGLNISYVTIFEGSEFVPKDEESKKIWQDLGIKDVREQGMDDVFWGPTGLDGPCGPTTEIYCKNASMQDVEIWNIVFNQYFCDGSREKLDKGEANLKKLETFGIDTGMGFERLLATVEKKESVYDTSLFEPIFKVIDTFNSEAEIKYKRIIADHLRTVMFLITDGVVFSNQGQGYVLRRLFRRAMVMGDKVGIQSFVDKKDFLQAIKDMYKEVYHFNDEAIISLLQEEEKRFRKTLDTGMAEFQKGTDPFVLATTYGFPLELTLELAKEKGIKIDLEEFNKRMDEHHKLSQTSSAGMFKGGLADHDPLTIKLHTAHHLLLAGLQNILGEEIKQKGSNITKERLRMDFSFNRKLTDEEKQKVEDWVNEHIQAGFNVIKREMLKEEAEKIGAEMEFGAKYPDTVSVYFIEDNEGNPISKEFCGGPHVQNTKDLGVFKIQKEEASSQGVRRIKAVLQ